MTSSCSWLSQHNWAIPILLMLSSGQEDGRAKDVGTAVLACCNALPLHSGEQILDCVAPSLQPRTALLRWRLDGMQAEMPCSDSILRIVLLSSPWVAIKALPAALPQHGISIGEVAGDGLCCPTPRGICWSCPLVRPINPDPSPLFEAGRRGGALTSVASLSASASSRSDCANSEKIRARIPLSDQRLKRFWRVLSGPWADRASIQRRPLDAVDDAAPHLALTHSSHTMFSGEESSGEEGSASFKLLPTEATQLGHPHPPDALSCVPFC